MAATFCPTQPARSERHLTHRAYERYRHDPWHPCPRKTQPDASTNAENLKAGHSASRVSSAAPPESVACDETGRGSSGSLTENQAQPAGFDGHASPKPIAIAEPRLQHPRPCSRDPLRPAKKPALGPRAASASSLPFSFSCSPRAVKNDRLLQSRRATSTCPLRAGHRRRRQQLLVRQKPAPNRRAPRAPSKSSRSEA